MKDLANKNDLVSVVIPVRDGQRYLAQAIDSVLAQSYVPVEVIVVDDGSQDATAEVSASFSGVLYDRQLPAGAAAARNRGVDLARGEFVAFLDADDVWMPDKLKWQVAAFNIPHSPHMIFGHVRQFISPELDEKAALPVRIDHQEMPAYHPGAMLIRRHDFLRVGPFEAAWSVGEFIDWYLKAVERGLRAHMVPEVVFQRRIHATNQGVLKRDLSRDYVRILKASLDRRRDGVPGA